MNVFNARSLVACKFLKDLSCWADRRELAELPDRCEALRLIADEDGDPAVSE